MTDIYAIVESDPPMSCRQVFYRMTSAGLIAKSEREYKNVVIRLLGRMRRERLLPFNWIADETRWVRRPTTYTSLDAALEATARAYRRSLWTDADAHVEVWIEKEALAGVVHTITEPWDVTLLPLRGYSSISMLYSVAEQLRTLGKPAFVYYFGDSDPSGVDIDRVAERDVRRFAGDVEIHFRRVAVLPEQISDWNLPSRPTKTTDSRSRSFDGESVELDAIPPGQLRALVQECIEQHIDRRTLRETLRLEQKERERLADIAEWWRT